MRGNLYAVLLAVGLANSGSVLAQEIEGSAFKVSPYWTGSAVNGDDGQFLYCSVSIIHGSGQQLWFLLRRDDTFHIVLNTGTASFVPGQEIQTLISINGDEPFKAFASATDAQNLLLSFPQVDHSITYFRQSALLTIAVSPKLTMTLGTPDIGPALDATRSCLHSYSAPG